MQADNTNPLSFEDLFSEWSLPLSVTNLNLPQGRLVTADEIAQAMKNPVPVSVHKEEKKETSQPTPIVNDKDGHSEKNSESITTYTKKKKKKNEDISRGKEIVDELYAKPDKYTEEKLHRELMDILERQIKTAVATGSFNIGNMKEKDLASEILKEMHQYINDIDTGKKRKTKKAKKKLPFSFSYIQMISKRLIFKYYAGNYDLKESQYYHIILVNRISEMYNLPLDKYYAYKFTRLINHHFPKVSLTNTKVLKAIDFSNKCKIILPNEDMENWADEDSLFD